MPRFSARGRVMIATVVCSVLLYAMLLLVLLCDFESPVRDQMLVKAFGERPLAYTGVPSGPC